MRRLRVFMIFLPQHKGRGFSFSFSQLHRIDDRGEMPSSMGFFLQYSYCYSLTVSICKRVVQRSENDRKHRSVLGNPPR